MAMGTTESIFADDEAHDAISTPQSQHQSPRVDGNDDSKQSDNLGQQQGVRRPSKRTNSKPICRMAGLVLGGPLTGKHSLLQRLEGKDPFTKSEKKDGHDDEQPKKSVITIPYKPPEETRLPDRILLHIQSSPTVIQESIDFVVVLINPMHDWEDIKTYALNVLVQLFVKWGYIPHNQKPHENGEEDDKSAIAKTEERHNPKLPICICFLFNFRDAVEDNLKRSPDIKLPQLSDFERLVKVVLDKSIPPADRPRNSVVSFGSTSMRNCFGLDTLHHFIYRCYLSRKQMDLEQQLRDIMEMQNRANSYEPTVGSYKDFLNIVEPFEEQPNAASSRTDRVAPKSAQKTTNKMAEAHAELTKSQTASLPDTERGLRGKSSNHAVRASSTREPVRARQPGPNGSRRSYGAKQPIKIGMDALEAFLASDDEEEDPKRKPKKHKKKKKKRERSKKMSFAQSSSDDEDDDFFYDESGQRHDHQVDDSLGESSDSSHSAGRKSSERGSSHADTTVPRSVESEQSKRTIATSEVQDKIPSTVAHSKTSRGSKPGPQKQADSTTLQRPPSKELKAAEEIRFNSDGDGPNSASDVGHRLHEDSSTSGDDSDKANKNKNIKASGESKILGPQNSEDSANKIETERMPSQATRTNMTKGKGSEIVSNNVSRERSSDNDEVGDGMSDDEGAVGHASRPFRNASKLGEFTQVVSRSNPVIVQGDEKEETSVSTKPHAEHSVSSTNLTLIKNGNDADEVFRESKEDTDDGGKLPVQNSEQAEKSRQPTASVSKPSVVNDDSSEEDEFFIDDEAQPNQVNGLSTRDPASTLHQQQQRNAVTNSPSAQPDDSDEEEFSIGDEKHRGETDDAPPQKRREGKEESTKNRYVGAEQTDINGESAASLSSSSQPEKLPEKIEGQSTQVKSNAADSTGEAIPNTHVDTSVKSVEPIVGTQNADDSEAEFYIGEDDDQNATATSEMPEQSEPVNARSESAIQREAPPAPGSGISEAARAAIAAAQKEAEAMLAQTDQPTSINERPKKEKKKKKDKDGSKKKKKKKEKRSKADD